MEIKEFYVNKTLFKAISIDLCDSSQLLMITSPKGYIMCGYLNINTAQKRGDIACIVTGVKTIDDVLNSKIVALTSNAQKLGIEMNMPIKQVLEKLS
ncbi:YunC family protein [Candidatus Ruminimicrobium bovinum]|uniref:YunC family protein n=1 Tax=Candidatus Ruminimicrobium bovinum TaxID=3242779 RepID=UPI0039B94043